MQLLKSGNVVRNDPHDDGAAPALFENIHAKTRYAREAVGQVRRPFLLEFADRSLVLAQDVVGNGVRVLRGQTLKAFIFQFDQLAADLDLRGSPGRKNQVADVRAGL